MIPIDAEMTKAAFEQFQSVIHCYIGKEVHLRGSTSRIALSAHTSPTSKRP